MYHRPKRPAVPFYYFVLFLALAVAPATGNLHHIRRNKELR